MEGIATDGNVHVALLDSLIVASGIRAAPHEVIVVLDIVSGVLVDSLGDRVTVIHVVITSHVGWTKCPNAVLGPVSVGVLSVALHNGLFDPLTTGTSVPAYNFSAAGGAVGTLTFLTFV
jgi:hypothetical protein